MPPVPDSGPESPPSAGAWTLATGDTGLSLAVRDHTLHLTGLRHVGGTWNWAGSAGQFPLLPEATLAERAVAAAWQFQGAQVATECGTRLTLRFRSAALGLELESEWWARPGPGPVRHAMSLRNASARTVGIASQPSLQFDLTAPAAAGLHGWYLSDEGGGGKFEAPGVFREPIVPGYAKQIVATPGYDDIPLVILDSAGLEGVYVGMEWSHAHITVAGQSAPAGQGVRLTAGNPADFRAELPAGATFAVPPAFVGAYRGDADDAGNSLRKYLFAHGMPAELRTDPTYPKLQWNAFTATGQCPTSQVDPKAWDPVEAKYYPLIQEVAALGFEEMTVDVGWWDGPEPDTDPIDWPQGMRAAGESTHRLGMRYVLYWTDAEPMATPEGRATRMRRVKRLFAEHGADTWRSDATRGQVIAPDYWSVKGFYDLLDTLQREVPGFQWENCSGGGPIKDYGAMRRATKIQICDTVDDALVTRRVFHDSAYALHPIQMQGFLGWHNRTRPGEPGGLVYDFRSAGLGAFMWWIDSPSPTNGGSAWSAADRQAVAREVHIYKARLRPLIRSANLYHVLPRPDGINWDGIEYFDPGTGQGVVYVFKPGTGPDTQRIILKGLEAGQTYRMLCADRSNPPITLPGEALMRDGVSLTLRGPLVSELVWIERV
jgi:hypothetical protein